MIEVFIPGNLENPLNHARQRFHGARLRKKSRAVAGAYYRAEIMAQRAHGVVWGASTPKRVTFLARLWNRMDDDGLGASLKGVRDALADVRLIDTDGPESGHEFVYQQVIDRKRRGVEVRVEAL